MKRAFKYVLLMVSDLNRSVEFYRDRLGFNFLEFHGPKVALLTFGEAPLILHADDGHEELTALNRRGQGLILGYEVDDVDRYFRQIHFSGLRVLHEPTNQEWGDRDFAVLDPDGYEIWFSQTVTAGEK